jgi:hypothetical protein
VPGRIRRGTGPDPGRPGGGRRGRLLGAGEAGHGQAEEARTADPERDTRLLEQAAALPNLRAAIAGLDRPGPAAGDAGFEYGLGLLIEGVRARHAELLSAAPARPVPAG